MAKIKRATGRFSPECPTDKNLWYLFPTSEIDPKLDTFLTGGLYLARLDRFKDPREGTLPRPDHRDLLDKAPDFAKKYILGAYKQARRQSFAMCFHRSSGEPSDYMWEHEKFGGRHDGVAIRTNPQRMVDALRPILASGAAHFQVIRYIDHSIDDKKNSSGTWNILQTHFVVRSDFNQEEEARLLLHTYGPSGSKLRELTGPKGPLVRIRKTRTNPSRHEFVGGYKRGTAVLLGIEPKQFIEEIVLGKRVSDSIYKRVVS